MSADGTKAVHLAARGMSSRMGDHEASVILYETPHGGLTISLHMTGRRGGKRQEAVVLNRDEVQAIYAAIAARQPHHAEECPR